MVTDDERKRLDRVIDDLALVGCHPRPLDQQAVLRALLCQHGHYVASEVVDLMGLAGVAPHSGWALVMKCGTWDPACAPPGSALRSNGEHDVLFYEESFLDKYPEREWTTEDMKALEAACSRWGQPSSYEYKLWFPWGMSSVDPARVDMYIAQRRRDAYEIDDEELSADWRPETPAEQHARSWSGGYVALAAGRVGDAVLHIAGARWMFDVETT